MKCTECNSANGKYPRDQDLFYQNSLNKIMFILIPICELSPDYICNFILLREIKITKLWKRE